MNVCYINNLIHKHCQKAFFLKQFGFINWTILYCITIVYYYCSISIRLLLCICNIVCITIIINNDGVVQLQTTKKIKNYSTVLSVAETFLCHMSK